jgi:RimJ/RimL family protein N-acetyltransferase
VAKIEIPAGPVRLRQMRTSDAADIRRIVTMPSVGRMLFVFPSDWSDAGARDFIRAWRFRGGLRFRLAVVDARDRLIGTAGVGEGADPPVFYFIDPSCAGHGTMTAAMRAFVAFLFDRFDMGALTAEVFTDNPASARVLEKLGFLLQGEGIGTSAQRLEPAAVWQYRLTREAFRA